MPVAAYPPLVFEFIGLVSAEQRLMVRHADSLVGLESSVLFVSEQKIEIFVEFGVLGALDGRVPELFEAVLFPGVFERATLAVRLLQLLHLGLEAQSDGELALLELSGNAAPPPQLVRFLNAPKCTSNFLLYSQ